MPRTIYPYKRIKTPVSDQKTLKDAGYTPFFSSNVSAGQRDGDDLYIRFHNGSVYKYPNQGKNFADLIVSPSKGKWVWANLRRTRASFSKVGAFPLAGDIDLTDEELIAMLAKSGLLVQAIKMVEGLSPIISPLPMVKLATSEQLVENLFIQSLIK